MPPKAKKGGKSEAKKKPSDDDSAEPVLTPEEQNIFLLRQLESSQHRLVFQTAKATEADNTAQELRTRLLHLERDFKEEKQRTFDITADMTRQYKAMKEELMSKIQDLKNDITSYQDKIEQEKLKAEDLERRKNHEIALKDAKITELSTAMDVMAREFDAMLKQTLQKMSEKIAITSEWDAAANLAKSVNDPLLSLSSMAGTESSPAVRTYEKYDLSLLDRTKSSV